MKIQSLGHVVLKVTDLKRAEAFYNGVLGMPIVARNDQQGMNMTFFSLGNHHDLALMEAPDADPSVKDNACGLHHVAFRIGSDIGELKEAKSHLEAAGIELAPIDHDVTKSLYFDDPDGNTVEVYVDVSEGWREDPQRIANVAPLKL